MVSSWRKRRNKRKGGNMGYNPSPQSFGAASSQPSFGAASSQPSFGAASSQPSSGSGFFGNLKAKAAAKAAELKMKADQGYNNMKNKANNLKFQAQMKGQEMQGRASNAFTELKNKRFDPSIQSAADNVKAGIPKLGQKAKEAAGAVVKIPGKLAGIMGSFTESAKSASQEKISQGQAQQIMENRQSQMGSVGGYRRKKRKSRRRRTKRKKSRRKRKSRRRRTKRKKSRRKKRRTRRRR